MENNQEITKPILLKDLGMIYSNENSKKKRRFGIYECSCGKEFNALTQNINNGSTKRCGCRVLKHGLRSHRLYKTWNGMMQRCYNKNNPNYNSYGAIGVTVCKEWHNIENFIMQSTFVPSCIYKTDLIDSTVMQNVYFNIPFMFPHLALMAKVLNNNLKYKILDNWIVKMQPHGGEETYTRGLVKDDVHPVYKNMFFQIGFINTLRMFKNKLIVKDILKNYNHINLKRPWFEYNYIIKENNRLAQNNQWNLNSIKDVVYDYSL